MTRMLTAAEFRDLTARQMTERALQDAVVELASRLGWLTYHTHDSRRSQPGFPDLVLVHEPWRRLLVVELKREKGRLSPAQRVWLDALAAAGVTTAVWRPSQLLDGTIRGELSRPPPRSRQPDDQPTILQGEHRC
jgi:hypothetical protein